MSNQKRWRLFRSEDGQSLYFNCTCGTTFIRIGTTFNVKLRNTSCGDEMASQIRGRCTRRGCNIRHDLNLADIEQESGLSQEEKTLILNYLGSFADGILEARYGIKAYIRKQRGTLPLFLVFFEMGKRSSRIEREEAQAAGVEVAEKDHEAWKAISGVMDAFSDLLRRDGFPLHPDTATNFFLSHSLEQNRYLRRLKQAYEELAVIAFAVQSEEVAPTK
jgi:hypothetical protein